MTTTRLLSLVTLVAACHGSATVRVGTGRDRTIVPPPAPDEPVPAGDLSVKAFGARGDGVTDDRVAFQAAIDQAIATGAELYVPSGTYSLSGAPRGYFALEVRGTIHVRGAGQDHAVLRQAPGTLASVRLMNVSGADVVIEDLTLDGNKAALPKNEQRHGLFVTHANRLLVQHVTARNFTGDGFYLFTGTRDARFVDDYATANDRNGITLGGDVDGTTIVGSRFIGNRAQQVDSEPGNPAVVSNTTITGSVLDPGGVSKQYVLTCSGTSAKNPGHDWRVIGNTINGGVFIVWADKVLLAGNVGTNDTPISFITVERSSSDVMIVGNRLVQAQHAQPAQSGVLIMGTAGSGPERVLVAGNDITTSYEQSFGVRASGAISVDIIGNTLRGAGLAAPGYAGVHLRATKLDQDFRSAVVRGNVIRDFGDRGINIVGNGAAKLLSVEISGNTFADDSATPSMTTGVSLDDGTGAVQRVQLDDNKYVGGVKSQVINVPPHAIRAVMPPKPEAQP